MLRESHRGGSRAARAMYHRGGWADPGGVHPEQQFSFGAATFVFDPTGVGPTRIEFRLPSLSLALVSRGQALTGDEWQRAGIYFLLGTGSEPGSYRIYVGKSPTGVASRVSNQETLKEWWDRALVVVADRSSGFSSAEVSWLEAAFIEKLRADLGESVTNKVQPVEASLPAWHVRELHAHLPPIEAVLRLLGVFSVAAEPELMQEPSEDPPSPTRGLTWLEAACAVLPSDGTPMHANEILEHIKGSNLRDLSGARTPLNTLRRDLRQSALNGGPVEQVGPSTFRAAQVD